MKSRPVNLLNKTISPIHYRIAFLGIAWLAYMGFVTISYTHYNIYLMLPNILLCGITTWLYGYKMGILTLLLSSLYNLLIMTCNNLTPDWSLRLDLIELLTQLFAILFVSKVKINHDKTRELTTLLETHIQQRNEELKEIAEHIIKYSETERIKIANKLCQIASYRISGLLHHSESLKNFLAHAHAPQTADAAKLVQIARQSIEQINDLTWKLSLQAIQKIGIKQSLQEMCDNLTETTGTNFLLAVDDSHRAPSNQTLAQPIYRIAHEATTNALRHGKASLIDIKLKMKDGDFALTIINNGQPLISPLIEGNGLHMIHQRAKAIHATAHYHTLPDGRTSFECASIPAAPITPTNRSKA